MRLSSYILITNVAKSNELNLDLAFTEGTTGVRIVQVVCRVVKGNKI